MAASRKSPYSKRSPYRPGRTIRKMLKEGFPKHKRRTKQEIEYDKHYEADDL